jgi:hypothetical protein
MRQGIWGSTGLNWKKLINKILKTQRAQRNAAEDAEKTLVIAKLNGLSLFYFGFFAVEVL